MSAATTAIIVCLMASTAGPQALPAGSPLAGVKPQAVRVVHYSPGTMQRVLRVRLRQGYHIPSNVDGYVSRPECSTIGQVVYLKIKGYSKVFRLAQVDCSQYRDKARHLAMNIVEVGWPIAKESGLYRDGHSTGTLWER